MRKRFLTMFFLMIVAMFSCSLLACKEKTEQSFDVSFYSETGELVNIVNTEDKDKFGNELSNKVEKLGTEKFEYKFVGWYTSEEGGKKVESLKDIDSATSLYPRFEEVLKRFDVKYHDAEGNLIFTANVGYGSPASFDGLLPEKEKDNKYEYVFIDWDTETSYVVEDMNVYPTYEPQFRFYNITFVNHDGSVLQTSQHTYDSHVAYNGKLPIKRETESHYYEFLRWDKQVTNATEDKVYTALYREIKKQFSVDFYIDGVLFASKLVYYGDNLFDIPNLPSVDGFEGEWDVITFENITENIKVNAVYNPIRYTVSFDMAGATTNNCSSLVLLYNDVYTLPNFDGYRFGYEFVGWEKDGVNYLPGQSFNIRERNIVYTARWKQIKYSLYQGVQTFNDYVNYCKIHLFENGELVVYTLTYRGTNLKLDSYYNISVVKGKYAFVGNKIEVSLEVNHSFCYDPLNNCTQRYEFSPYCENTELIASDSGDSVSAAGIEYKLLSKDNYVEDNISQVRQIIGVALNKNPVFVEGDDVNFDYAIVMYSDMTLEFVDEFSVGNIPTSMPSVGRFDVVIDNAKFVFEYNIITTEDSKKVDHVSVSGDQLYLVGSELGLYTFNAEYFMGYKQESYSIDGSKISGFDTSTPGIKTLTFNLEEGEFKLDIYVLENLEDVINFESYCDTYINDVRTYGYNVFLQDSEVSVLGVKYGNCSVSYLKAINGLDLVNSYIIKEIDVSSYNISTSECGFYRIKVEIEGKSYEVEYSIVDEYTYYLLDGYELAIENNATFLVGEDISTQIHASYGNGSRYEYLDVDSVENVVVKGLSTKNKGISNVYLFVDGEMVDSKQIIILENESDLLVLRDYYSDKNKEYLYENVFILGQQVKELSIRYSQTTYSYNNEEAEYIEGLEVIDCCDIDTTSVGLRVYKYLYNGVEYSINYLVVEEIDYITVSDFNVIGQLSYIVGEDVELKLELELVYGDNCRKEIISANGFISEYDNSTIGAKVLTITYSGITKKFIVYYFDSIYGFIDYQYYEDYLLDNIDYKTENIFYIDYQISEVAVNQVNVRRYYDGTEAVEKTVTKFQLEKQLDTASVGVYSVPVETLAGIVKVEYKILNEVEYFDETGYEVVGNKVLTPYDEVNLKLIIEYANGARHEIVDIAEEDVPDFSREDIGQQVVSISYNQKSYLFSLFNYVPERDDTSDFIEVEYYDTSLEDYYNSMSVNNKYAEFMAKVTYKIYNIYGELIDVIYDFERVYTYIENSSVVGVYICEINLLGKIIKVQYVVE